MCVIKGKDNAEDAKNKATDKKRKSYWRNPTYKYNTCKDLLNIFCPIPSLIIFYIALKTACTREIRNLKSLF